MTTVPRNGPAVPPIRPGAVHDPELPILAELEAELERELRALGQPAGPALRAIPLRTPARVARRALVLVALLSLVGGSAVAGRAVLAGSPRAPSSGPALLSSGGQGADHWQLEAYLHEGSVCYAMFVADTASSACGTPGGKEVRATSALSPTRRFVAGIAGAGVTHVLVRVGHRDLLIATHAPAGAHRAKLSPGLRWFLASLAGAGARQGPARVTPLDRAGRRVGPAVLDCSLGAGSPLCQEAAERISGVGSGSG
jgi:hypothetical protein